MGPVLWPFAAIALATVGIEHSGRLLGLEAYTHLALAALFLMTALQLAQRHPGGLAGHGLWLGGLFEASEEARPGFLGAVLDLLRVLRQALPSAAQETGSAIAIAAFTFPPFVAGFYFLHEPTHEFVVSLPDSPIDFAAAQILVVALPEEAFFRGYLQTQLARLRPATRKIFGRPWPVQALLIQALLFAVLHYLVDLNPARLAVFFPAIVFGAMRHLRGGIGAGIIYHALCNILSDLLVRGWL